MNEINLEVEPTARAPRVSRSRLAAIRAALEPVYDDVAVVTSELVTNSVRYGSGTDEIRVAVTTSNDKVRIEVSDVGPCFEKATSRDGGMGLDIVGQIADSWGVEHNGRWCTVWAEVPRSTDMPEG